VSVNTVILIVSVACILAAIFLTDRWDFKDGIENKQGRNEPSGPREEQIPHSTSANFSKLIDAIHYEGDANRKEENTEDRGQRHRDYFTIMILVATFVTLAITCVAIFQQVGEMQKVYGPISDQSKTATDQLTAMIGQQGAMRDQLAVMKADRRPWLAFDDTISVVKPLVFDQNGAHVTIAGTIRNGGKSVAKDIMTVQSRLVVEPLIPQGDAPIALERTSGLEMRGFPYPNPCGVDIAKQFTSIGGSLILAGGTQRWPVSGDDHLDVPTSQFELNTFGQVSVFLDICIFYKDDSDGIHGTSTVLIFADDKNGDNFPPGGQISGSFRPISGNDAAY
jgi:hypothetical protein